MSPSPPPLPARRFFFFFFFRFAPCPRRSARTDRPTGRSAGRPTARENELPFILRVSRGPGTAVWELTALTADSLCSRRPRARRVSIGNPCEAPRTCARSRARARKNEGTERGPRDYYSNDSASRGERRARDRPARDRFEVRGNVKGGVEGEGGGRSPAAANYDDFIGILLSLRGRRCPLPPSWRRLYVNFLCKNSFL